MEFCEFQARLVYRVPRQRKTVSRKQTNLEKNVGEVARLFRALAALPGDPGLFDSQHPHGGWQLSLQFQRIRCCFLAFIGMRDTHGAETHTQEKHP